MNTAKKAALIMATAGLAAGAASGSAFAHGADAAGEAAGLPASVRATSPRYPSTFRSTSSGTPSTASPASTPPSATTATTADAHLRALLARSGTQADERLVPPRRAAPDRPLGMSGPTPILVRVGAVPPSG